MTTASTNAHARHERRAPSTVARPSLSPAARLALGVVVALAVGSVLLCSTPVARFPSWREVVAAAGSAVSLWCLWTLRTELVHEIRGRRPGVVTLSAAAVAAGWAWTVGALFTDGRPVDLGVAAVVAVVVLACNGIQRESGLEPAPLPGWFVPVAIAVAAATGSAWLAVDARPSRAFGAGVAVLIAACPAAIGLALPAAYRTGTRRGDALGVEIQEANALRTSQRVDTLVLDGLSSLVSGKRVASVDAFTGHERNLRWFAGALEHASDHPVGKAIAKLSARGRLSGVKTHPGLGISGSVDRHPVRVGRPDWIGIEVPERVGTTVGVEVDSRPLGTITVVDAVLPTASVAVRSLRRLGVDPVLVTTSNPLTAKDLAEQLGIDRFSAEAAPGAAAHLVSELHAQSKVVATLSDVPIDGDLTLSTADEAWPHADVLLRESDVTGTVTALGLARTIDDNVRQSTTFAYAYAAVASAAAASAVVPPLIAALGLSASVAVVLLNAARLRRFEGWRAVETDEPGRSH